MRTCNVANGDETAPPLFFDDFTVIQTGLEVVQHSDYYPFGYALRDNWTKEYEDYRFGYQGEYAEKDQETGFSHFELREYDVLGGRWFSADPMRQYPSPYVGMGNNPVNYVDPTGGLVPWLVENSTGSVTWVNNDEYKDDPSKWAGWEILSWDWDFFGADAYLTFLDRGFEPMNFEESVSFMKENGYKLAPVELIDQYTERNNLPHVDGPSVTVKDIVQVWTNMTYIPKSFDVSNYTLRVLDQEQGVASYSLIRSLNYSYERKNGFYWLLNGGRSLYETGSDFTNKSVHYGWENYPRDDSWLNTFRGF